ncbi:MAG: response regulator [Candidatus Staskawiczbacteria bacterium]|nr:response regulator [Candidatus Staskawiczbacteria bacterium]
MDEDNKTKILIVEDEELILKPYSEELRDEGFFVLQAKNGQEGLGLALSEKPDIILLDILMPVMDGITMMYKLRETNPYGKDVPIILLTNLSPDEEKTMKAVVDNEPAYYLVKSDWNLKDVVGKIKERLERKA